MQYFDVQSTLLIVVGHGILPEEEDRPIAYEIKRAVRERTAGHEDRLAVVLTDAWMLNNDMAEMFPALAIGGPGSNAFTAQLYNRLPITCAKEQQWFIQFDEESREKRAAVWGMESALTREAGEAFIRDGYLTRFLAIVWPA